MGWYPPDSSGGTEIYVENLVGALKERNIEGFVFAPWGSNTCEEYVHDGSVVYRYPARDQNIDSVRGLRPHEGFDDFKRLVKKCGADLYHQHSWTQGCGIHHLRFVKSQGIPTVVTAHVPGFICKRGTMMRFGEETCAGKIDEKTCTHCVAHARGVGKAFGGVVSMMPRTLGDFLTIMGLTGKLASALSMRTLMHHHEQNFLQMIELSGRIVVLSEWMYEAMRANGVGRSKLFLCRHGIDADHYRSAVGRKSDSGVLKIGFLGRADPVKGLDRIVEAVSRLDSTARFELRIFAIVDGEAQRDFLGKIRNKVLGDRRILFEAPVSPSDVPRIMAEFDILAVPSQWLETGPLTVLEALASGTPVLGSDLGGIREYVQDGVNGRLVSPTRTGEWSDAIRELIDNPSTLGSYRSNIGKIRSMEDVALEMACVYEEVRNTKLQKGTLPGSTEKRT